MRRGLYLSILLALAGCKNSSNNAPPVVSQSETSLNEEAKLLYGRYAYRMIKEQGLWGYNVTLPVSPDSIEVMGLQLVTPRMVPLAQARGMILVAGSALLEEIKKNTQLQSYLPDDFGWDSLMMGITFLDQTGKRVSSSESVSSVALLDGNLVYRSYDVKKGKFEVVHHETAKDAYKEMVASKFWDQQWDWSLLAPAPPPGAEWLAGEDQRANVLELNALYGKKYSRGAPRPQIISPDKNNLCVELKKSKELATKLNVNLPSNFEFGFEELTDESFMFEYIPKGEDLNSWTEIITIMQFKMQNPMVKDYVKSLEKQYINSGAELGYKFLKENDLPIALTNIELDAINPSQRGSKIPGKKELIMTKVCQGDQTLSFVQYSIRYDTRKTSLVEKENLEKKMEIFLNSCTIE